MKKLIPALLACFITISAAAQDVRLSDSVIFINNKPVALYEKWLNNSASHHNMEVYSFTDYILIKAEVIQFNAPVEDLKSFYYYEISFPPVNDTVSVFVKDEAFPIVLAKIIRDYKLIDSNQLNAANFRYFKTRYPGKAALLAKINEVNVHLNETRFFNEQVMRDRTKPVSLIDDKIIMQDGVRIGMIGKPVDRPVGTMYYQIPELERQSNYNTAVAESIAIYLETQQVAHIRGNFSPQLTKKDRGYQLYQISKPKNAVPGSVEDLVFRRICFLIEDYSL